MNPRKTLIFLLSTLGLLTVLALVVPKEGFVIGNFTIKYPGLEKFMVYKPVQKKDISKITSRLDKKFKKEKKKGKKHNNANLDGVTINADTSAEEVDEEGMVKISFGKDNDEALTAFFDKLSSASANKKNVRIIHYGDSQIEGDRITAYLRNKIQSKFGGYGPGMIPFFNVYHTNSFVQTLSANFKRFTSFPSFAKGIKHKRYGAMCSFARFTPVLPDSAIAKNAETEAWVEIGSSKSAYGTAQSFNKVKIFYGNCRYPVSINVYNGAELIHTDSLIHDGATHVFELSFDKTPEKLKYVFKGKDSPDFYAFILDGAYGVGVDNVAMRGSTGTFVNSSDVNQLKTFYDYLGTELFIMQFGGNAVPYMKDSAAARTIANHIASQLYTLKKLRPGCGIIVIGPSDMSNKIDGEWKTYPLLPAFISYLKAAVHKTGAGYWDMYSAMGGENSMPTWVEKNLAGPDYTHFTPGGAKFVAELFYEAFIFEYNKYLEKKKKAS